MTNGEMIQTILDVDRDCVEVHGENGTMTFTVTQDFWNSEYKESTTKNDLSQERYQDLIDYFGNKEVAKTILENRKEFKAWLERVKWHVKRADELVRELEQIQGTTKNDLAVDCIDRQATLDAIIKRLGIKNETYLLEAERVIYQQILAMPSVTPQLSSELEKNSKKLEKDFGESDCISRQAVLELIADDDLSMGQVVRGIHALPTVTPQEPRVDFKELKRKILMEVDGGTDDAWLAYGEVCDRISNAIDEFVSDMRGKEE